MTEIGDDDMPSTQEKVDRTSLQDVDEDYRASEPPDDRGSPDKIRFRDRLADSQLMSFGVFLMIVAMLAVLCGLPFNRVLWYAIPGTVMIVWPMRDVILRR